MHAALPRSEYYDGSVSPAPSAGVAPIPTPSSPDGRKVWNVREWFPRSLLSGQRARHPALPLRYRHGYAVDNSPWPPNPDSCDPGPKFPNSLKEKERVRTANQPKSAGLELAGTQEA